jgi:hypothetical protein
VSPSWKSPRHLLLAALTVLPACNTWQTRPVDAATDTAVDAPADVPPDASDAGTSDAEDARDGAPG